MTILKFLSLSVGVAILKLFVFTTRLLPMAPGETIDVRMRVAEACAMATEDPTEQFLCAKIPRFESAYRADVARCEKKGSAGEVTAWQILPRSPEDSARLCQSFEEDAKVAIERIRESRRACRHLPVAEQLAIYTRGSCSSEQGRKLSRVRWPYVQETTF